MENTEGTIRHFGVKGMHWGTRKKTGKVTVQTGPGGRIRTTGGHGRAPSSDAVKAAKLGQRARKSTTKSLSNQELRDLLQRMQLEKQYRDLQGDGAFKKGTKIVRDLLGAAKLGKDTYDFVKANLPSK
jgi:hypothetical protein